MFVVIKLGSFTAINNLITNLVRHIIAVNERRLAINITPIRLSCGDMSLWDIKTLNTLKY